MSHIQRTNILRKLRVIIVRRLSDNRCIGLRETEAHFIHAAENKV
jgi:hypothetical protein